MKARLGLLLGVLLSAVCFFSCEGTTPNSGGTITVVLNNEYEHAINAIIINYLSQDELEIEEGESETFTYHVTAIQIMSDAHILTSDGDVDDADTWHKTGGNNIIFVPGRTTTITLNDDKTISYSQPE
ncbi:MAG: hypothetical protein FWH12_07505 [Treponema sp.]|nr:hypothetical protein [Treponema sp.]